MRDRRIRPAIVTVGDELIHGEQQNGNQTWLLQEFSSKGIPATFALSVSDSIAEISKSLKFIIDSSYYPIFISGGIGGTHDDRTREGIAVALDRPLVKHQECFEILLAKFGERFTPQRQRMACLPEGCTLITNPIGAPGFSLNGVFAFPGFPSMLKPMVSDVLDNLLQHETALTPPMVKEYTLPVSEGAIAVEIETFVNRYPTAKVGLYPSDKKFGKEITIRLRCTNVDDIIIAKFESMLRKYR